MQSKTANHEPRKWNKTKQKCRCFFRICYVNIFFFSENSWINKTSSNRTSTLLLSQACVKNLSPSPHHNTFSGLVVCDGIGVRPSVTIRWSTLRGVRQMITVTYRFSESGARAPPECFSLLYSMNILLEPIKFFSFQFDFLHSSKTKSKYSSLHKYTYRYSTSYRYLPNRNLLPYHLRYPTTFAATTYSALPPSLLPPTLPYHLRYYHLP